MTWKTKIGAAGFLLWGVLHLVGGGAILAGLWHSPEAGYAVYRHDAAVIPAVAGGVLGYLAYGFAVCGGAVAVIALRRNWRNDPVGLMVNTTIVALVEVGLVLFLWMPGYLSLADAAPGFSLFAVGAVFGGLACKGDVHATGTI